MTTIGQGIDRVEGARKVCGQVPFAAEFRPAGAAGAPPPAMLHAVMVTSTVAAGRIVRMDTAAAEAMPGVVAVLTPMNAPRLPQRGQAGVNPPAGRVLSLLQDDTVSYANQPVAVAVADTLERATAAAHAVRVVYADAPAVLDFAAAKPRAYAPAKANREPTDHRRGDWNAGWAAGTAKVEAVYTTPVEHHNPMEPHATLAEWSGDRLTLHDATQNVGGVRNMLAKTFAVAPENVTVVDPYVGGGFGCKGSAWSHVVLAALAARATGRPVRLVLERPQMFGPVGNRPRTEQTLRLAADASGTLTAIQHATVAETSVLEDWLETSSLAARMLYACPNVDSTHRLVKLNIATPTFTRAPGEASGSFALESAMDELAHAARLDPLALRLKNHADTDPSKGKPFSSKSLRACYAAGAERFGWARRKAEPGALRDGRWRVGLGMATATYPANRSAADATVRAMADGTFLVRCATHDLGTGTYTVMSQVAADAIGVPVSAIRFELGDSRFPKSPGAGGSQSAASVSPAVHAAGLAMRERLAALRAGPGGSADEPVASIVARSAAPVEVAAGAAPGAEREAFSLHAFGAVFAEVRVDAELGVVRVSRVSGTYGVGTVLNEKLARSQMEGGIVWGIGMALFEASMRDDRYGRVVNGSLAEYHVPVNADIGAIDVAFVPERDPHINALGVKGIGEIGITGVPAAIANAVFNATGKRVRDLPITLDTLL